MESRSVLSLLCLRLSLSAPWLWEPRVSLLLGYSAVWTECGAFPGPLPTGPCVVSNGGPSE